MSRTNHTAYDRLVAAGAPPLPGDRFYRVRETLENILVVEIREPGRFGGSRRLASAVVVMRGDLVSDVARAARDASSYLARREDSLAVVGDYRP